MRRLLPATLAALVVLVGLGTVMASCKQEDGERCQKDSDCQSGVCNPAQHICAGGGDDNNPIDATPPIDGPRVDAPIDAGPPIDAPPDI
jgi:hypothetical protein